MFKKVVVGIDGEDGGRDAIALAQALRSDDAELIFAHVYVGEPIAWRGASAAYEEVLREDAAKLLHAARDEAGVEASLKFHSSPSIGRGLHEMAEDLGADLLVVGSSRRGHFGRVGSADDTRHALNGAPCPVAVAPAGYAQLPAGIHKIGVAYDASPESECALTFARQMAGERSAKLAACQVVHFPARFIVGPAFPDRSSIEQSLQEVRDRVAQLDGVEPHARYGDPAEELAQFSQSQDLLVIGSRGYGPTGRLLYGSTSQRLARMARCPLVVLTRQTGGPENTAESARAEVVQTA